MSKSNLYSVMIFLHITIGLSFRWYLKEKFGRITHDIPNNVIIVDQTHTLCSKIWQYLLCILFSDQGANEHTNNIPFSYFSQNSLWLNQYSFSTVNSNANISHDRIVDLKNLATWRFTLRRRRFRHGANEYYSDIELEESSNINEQDNKFKKASLHRCATNSVSMSQQDHFYTSESDENNNSLKSNSNEINSSKIYQCSICLENYLNNVYICTLPCLHHFHRKCLFDWFVNSEHSTCPLCRSPVLI